MEKLDLVKTYKQYYTATKKPALVDIEEAGFLSIVGKGDPSSALFAEKIQALYTVAYALKFTFKQKGKDFAVAKLEGLWWFNNKKYPSLTIEETPRVVPRSEWNWRLLIRMPDFIKEKEVKEAVASVLQKKELPYLNEPEFFTLHEGKAVQMLHVGSFADEPKTLTQIHAFITKNKLAGAGLHHEIYLSDFRKTAPDKLKTILREPVK